MRLFLTIALYITIFGLIVYIVRNIIRERRFSISDAIATLAILVGIAIAQQTTSTSPTRLSSTPPAETTPILATSNDQVTSTPTSTTTNTVQPIASNTPQPTATNIPESPTPTKTPMATQTPTAKSGDVLYEADWSNGLNGWRGASSWKSVSGMLVNAGPEGNGAIIAPYRPESITDYAVEAEIQVVDMQNFCRLHGFGFLVRLVKEGGYVVGADPDIGSCSPSAYIWNWDGGGYSHPGPTLEEEPFAPGTDWHTYRVEVKGNTITLFVDNALVIETVNNKYLAGGQVGLWSTVIDGLNVRSFKVIML